MPDIFCFKTLKNYYKINSEEIEKINPQNSWSTQKFKADEKSCVMFLHHTTAFYFVLFGVGKNDFEQIETLFVEGFFNQIEKFVALNDEEKISIKKKLTNFRRWITFVVPVIFNGFEYMGISGYSNNH